MANNRIRKDGYHLSVVCDHPTTPVAGEPVRYGTLTGVALTNESADGNASGYTSVDFGPSVWDVTVDDNEDTGIAVGAAVYFHDSGTGTGSVHLNNTATASDAYFGIALEVVGTSATTKIQVLHQPVGGVGALASNAVVTGSITDANVTTAKIATANITEALLDTLLTGAADGLGFLRVARFTFDPTNTVGYQSIAAHGLGVTLPDNAVVVGGGMEITTGFADGASDNATIALSINGANDLVTATAISSGTFWDAVKWKVIVPDAMAAAGVATPIKLTAAREITATVAVHALTEGVLTGWLYYVIGI